MPVSVDVRALQGWICGCQWQRWEDEGSPGVGLSKGKKE